MAEDARDSSARSGLDAATAARHLVRASRKGALATVDRTTGHPYASLVAVATEPDGAPILLLSGLAQHSLNLSADSRASLLIEDCDGSVDPLTAGRVTLIGHVRPTMSATAARRYLTRHPAAQRYAGFADFSYYVLTPERAHFVGGFGRIAALAGPDVLIHIGDAAEVIAAEADTLAALNRDCAAELRALGARVGRGRKGPWRAIGLDPAGLDLALDGGIVRCDFLSRATVPSDVRRRLEELLA